MPIDAYLHIGLPRFQSIANAVSVMDRFDIEKALICPFETCPDLAAVHAGMLAAPERFLAVGIPVGASDDAVADAIRAQFAAGFAGLRLSGEDVRNRPWILDLIGEAGGFALVCTNNALAAEAGRLLAYLHRYDSALVIGGHFAGPTDPTVLSSDPRVAELFAHERFAVVFSRHGLFPTAVLDPWVSAVIGAVGWDRICWGSEAPVLYWRDETMADALRWVDGLGPSESERERFFFGNAERLLFDRPRAEPAPLRLPFDPFTVVERWPAAMWPHGLLLDDALAGRLVNAWLGAGGDRIGPLRSYVERMLDEQLPPAGDLVMPRH